MVKEKRKAIFVDKPVQGMLVRRFLLHWVITAIVILLFLLTIQVFSATSALPLSEHLAALWSRYAPLLLAFALVFPIFIYDSIKLSHRFAGPMVSFRRALGRLSRGEEIAPIRFRDGDFWKELAVDLNGIAKRMGLLASTKKAGVR